MVFYCNKYSRIILSVIIIDNSENKTGYIGGITMEIIKEKLDENKQ